jgi:UDP-N-acetylmuramoylalanine--D-glutamate ligase
MTLHGRNALVVGLGRSGVAAARLLRERGARVTATDKKPLSALGAVADVLGPQVRLELGGHRAHSFRAADLVVLSPGVPPLDELREARGEVVGEFELGCRLLRAEVVAITGTNGKSTTTSLVGEMLRCLGRPIFVGGNLGTPVCEAVGGPADRADGIVVAEVSSFQLETVGRYHARAAALLNVTEDHLDRYPDMEAYRRAKMRVFLNQTAGDFAVVRGDLASATRAATPARTFSFASDAPADATLDAKDIVLCGTRLPTTGLPLVGRHNLENLMAALLVGRCLGVAPADALAAARGFRPLPHRMEPVAERAGVAFFDDSKATNVGAVASSLAGFPRPVVLIAGGRDKGGSYAPLRDAAQKVVRAAVLIGEARERIAAALQGAVAVDLASDMGDAVRRAAAIARPGDAVVLSPACSSYDMFSDYADRGRAFRAAVEALQ